MPGAHAPVLEPVRAGDLAAVRALNEGAVPAVNSVPISTLECFARAAECFTVARVNGVLGGFLVLLGPGADYESPNYLWFAARYRDFLYVDRVVVAPEARRRGVASVLYRDAWRRACARGAPLACEVNLEPPNPASLAFHRALGFCSVGRQSTEGGTKTVALMLREPGCA